MKSEGFALIHGPGVGTNGFLPSWLAFGIGALGFVLELESNFLR